MRGDTPISAKTLAVYPTSLEMTWRAARMPATCLSRTCRAPARLSLSFPLHQGSHIRIPYPLHARGIGIEHIRGAALPAVPERERFRANKTVIGLQVLRQAGARGRAQSDWEVALPRTVVSTCLAQNIRLHGKSFPMAEMKRFGVSSCRIWGAQRWSTQVSLSGEKCPSAPLPSSAMSNSSASAPKSRKYRNNAKLLPFILPIKPIFMDQRGHRKQVLRIAEGDAIIANFDAYDSCLGIRLPNIVVTALWQTA